MPAVIILPARILQGDAQIIVGIGKCRSLLQLQKFVLSQGITGRDEHNC